MTPQAYASNTPPMFASALQEVIRQHKPREKDPANEVYARFLEATFATNLPSYPLDSPFEAVNHYKSVIYLGIQALMDAMSGATCRLEKKRRQQGAINPQSRPTDQDYVPFEDHPFAEVLAEPNPVDTFEAFLSQCILQYHLTGRLLIWGLKNQVEAPYRMYVLPTALCTPAYGLGNALYPKGAWRVQQYYPGSGLMGILPGPLGGTAGAVIDARDVYVLQNPHPLYRWAPYSPMTGTDVDVDLLEMIDRSAWSCYRQGYKPSGVVDLPGAGPDQIKAVQDVFNNEHAGVDNHGKLIAIGGGRPDRPAAKFNPIVPSADTMVHRETWELYAGVVLAAVCGLNLRLVGLQSGGSYSEYWAAIQDVRIRKYQPFLGKIASLLTNGPARDWNLPKKGVRVGIHLPSMQDPTLIDARNSLGANTSSITVNEIRASWNMPPLNGGDVPPRIFEQQLLIAKGLAPDPTGATGLSPVPVMPMPAPGAGPEQQAPPGGGPPENEQAEGALPPRQTKAIRKGHKHHPFVLRGRQAKMAVAGLVRSVMRRGA